MVTIKYSGTGSVIKAVILTILFVAIVAALVFAQAWIWMVLVNWVMRLFGVAFAISYWQAFASMLLMAFIGSFFKTQKTNQNP